MRALERRGRLDRAVEFLPDDETIAQRAAAKRGLTRPEIAVLLAYAKNVLYDELLASDLPDAPELKAELLAYFPERLRSLAPETTERPSLATGDHRNLRGQRLGQSHGAELHRGHADADRTRLARPSRGPT